MSDSAVSKRTPNFGYNALSAHVEGGQHPESALDKIVNSGPKLVENQRFEIAARPHLAVDFLVANHSGTPYPVKAAAAEGGGQRPAFTGAWRSAKLGHWDRRLNATQSGNFKPLVLGEIHAAGDT